MCTSKLVLSFAQRALHLLKASCWGNRQLVYLLDKLHRAESGRFGCRMSLSMTQSNVEDLSVPSQECVEELCSVNGCVEGYCHSTEVTICSMHGCSLILGVT